MKNPNQFEFKIDFTDPKGIASQLRDYNLKFQRDRIAHLSKLCSHVRELGAANVIPEQLHGMCFYNLYGQIISHVQAENPQIKWTKPEPAEPETSQPQTDSKIISLPG